MNPEKSVESAVTTHQKIADALGISRATVSRALQNSPRISETTRRRVQEAAKELDYRPNPLVSALMARLRARQNDTFQGTIAVLTDREERTAWHLAHPTWKRMFQGATARAHERGFEFETFSMREFDREGRRLSQILVSRGIHGVFVAPGLVSREVKLEWDRFSVGTAGYCLLEPRCNRVCHDNFQAVWIACQRLFELGYRRMGLYLNKRDDDVTNHRYRAGFKIFQSDFLAGKDRIEPEIVPLFTPGDFVSWLKTTRPDVVLAGQPQVIQWAEAAGWHCPSDFGFVHLDRPADRPELAGIDHNAEHLGRSVVDMIIAQIQRNETGIPGDPADLLVQGHWVGGPTVASAVSGMNRPPATRCTNVSVRSSVPG